LSRDKPDRKIEGEGFAIHIHPLIGQREAGRGGGLSKVIRHR